MLPHVERPESNDNTRSGSEGCYHYLRASTHAVEPEMSDAIIVSAHVELEKIVKITSINAVRVFLTICSNVL